MRNIHPYELGFIFTHSKNLPEFKESIDNLYIRETHTFKRQMELSQDREEIHHTKKSTFTLFRPQGECNPKFYSSRVLSYKNQTKRFLDLN